MNKKNGPRNKGTSPTIPKKVMKEGGKQKLNIL